MSNVETNRTVGLLEPEPPTKTTKTINRLFVVALFIIAITIGTFLKWSFQSEDVIKVNNTPFPTRSVQEHSSANGVIILKVNFCKNVDTQGDLRMSFVSKSREVLLPIAKERTPKGCQNTEVPILIPRDLPADTYKIKFVVTYDLNPLKKGIVSEFESKEFQVE